MEQRAREMGKTSEAAVYRKYINSMKKKTKKMNEETKYDRYDKEKKKFAKSDNRMKFGKFYAKAKEARDRLRPGEVKKYDKEKGRYVSNKDECLYRIDFGIDHVSIFTSTRIKGNLRCRRKDSGK